MVETVATPRVLIMRVVMLDGCTASQEALPTTDVRATPLTVADMIDPSSELACAIGDRVCASMQVHARKKETASEERVRVRKKRRRGGG